MDFNKTEVRLVILFRSDLFKNKTATVSPYKPGTQKKLFKQPIKKSNSTVYTLKPELTEMQTQKQTKTTTFRHSEADHNLFLKRPALHGNSRNVTHTEWHAGLSYAKPL